MLVKSQRAGFNYFHLTKWFSSSQPFPSLYFFPLTNGNLKIFVVAETVNCTLKCIFPFTGLQFQISLGAGVFMRLRSCPQNVSVSDICNLSLLAQGPLHSSWILKSPGRMEPPTDLQPPARNVKWQGTEPLTSWKICYNSESCVTNTHVLSPSQDHEKW